MYAGAIYDPVLNKLLIFRDRFGIKPLYYTEWDNNFIFSSEIKPVLLASERPKELNSRKMATFFTYRYVPGEETMFSGIKRLPPGSYLEYDLRKRSYCVKRYWEYRLDRIKPDLALDEAIDEFYALFSDAVNIRLRSDVEIGSLLSGGIDSSAVSSQAAGSMPGIKLFTISFDESNYNELPMVKRFLKANKDRFYQANHQTRLCGRNTLEQLPLIIRALEEPISLGTVLPTTQICSLASEHVKVVLTGEGADEIFAGYRKFLIEMAACEYSGFSYKEQQRLDKAYPELKYYLAAGNTDPVKRHIQSEALFNRDELHVLLGMPAPSDLFPEDALPSLSGCEHPLNALIALECRSRLPDYVILRLDKLSMMHSLETRTPFLDYRLAEFAATLPVRFKVNLNTGQEKFICRQAFLKNSILDKKTVCQKKQPFTIPLADWLAEPLRLPDFLQEILLGGIVEKQGLLNANFVKELVGKVSAKGIGPQTLVSEADRVFAVIMFTLWYDEFF